MKYNNQRRAFTLIELIFVVVIVGILAIVSIPRLISNKDDANAAVCTQGVQELIGDISRGYTRAEHKRFISMPIEEITNISLNIDGGNGISDSEGTLIADGITYRCDGDPIILLIGELSDSGNYNLTATDLNPTNNPAGIKAADLIRKLNAISTPGGSKVYRL